MSYKIVNRQGRGLNGFYSNEGFDIKDVFAFSSLSNFIFKSEQDAQNYILRMIKESKEQRDRWGDWTDKALKFIDTFSISKS